MEEKLLEELIKECDRLTEIIDSSEVGSDEWKMAHSRKLDVLEKMQAFYKTETEYQIKFEDREATLDHDVEMLTLEEKKLEQHMEIERLRAEEARALEDMKRSWKAFGFAIGTVVLPELLKIVYHNAHTDKVLGFEEHGRIVSSIGRQLKLPKL